MQLHSDFPEYCFLQQELSVISDGNVFASLWEHFGGKVGIFWNLLIKRKVPHIFKMSRRGNASFWRNFIPGHYTEI